MCRTQRQNRYRIRAAIEKFLNNTAEPVEIEPTISRLPGINAYTKSQWLQNIATKYLWQLEENKTTNNILIKIILIKFNGPN